MPSLRQKVSKREDFARPSKGSARFADTSVSGLRRGHEAVGLSVGMGMAVFAVA